MPRKVRFRQLNSHGKYLHPDNNPRHLLRDVVLPAPSLRINYPQASRPKDDPHERREWRLGKV